MSFAVHIFVFLEWCVVLSSLQSTSLHQFSVENKIHVCIFLMRQFSVQMYLNLIACMASQKCKSQEYYTLNHYTLCCLM